MTLEGAYHTYMERPRNCEAERRSRPARGGRESLPLTGPLNVTGPLNGPILFGTQAAQELLVRIFREGQVGKPAGFHITGSLRRSGLIAQARMGRGSVLVLAPGHPARDLLCKVLATLNGAPGCPPRVSPDPAAEYAFDPAKPLGHRSALWFRVVLHIARAPEPIPLGGLRFRIPDAYPPQLEDIVQKLLAAGVVDHLDSSITIASAVPSAFRDLVVRLGDILAPLDGRLAASSPMIPGRPSAYQRAEDGAPRLFGSDVRLRNLMALAKYGAMYSTELRRVTGVSGQKLESRDLAPFGRGGVVNAWSGDDGVALQLDSSFPLFLPLRRLLLKLEQLYPLPPLVRSYPEPTVREPAAWNGDKWALFGSPIVTSILMTIGVLGWTFEALCVSTSGGYDRTVVKKALATLHDEGLLESDRTRRPGFNTRIVRLAERFAAKEELLALLTSAATIWPELRDRVAFAVSRLSPRTRVHLQKRGMLQSLSSGVEGGDLIPNAPRDHRLDCLTRYYALTTRVGRTVSSHELMRLDSNLYRSIRAAWGSFSAFRAGGGIPEALTGKTRKPCSDLRRDCISEYHALAQRIGYLPNTSDLNRLDAWLSERIRIQWDGFPEFCEDLKLSPARRKRSSRSSEHARQSECRAEYLDLVQRLGRRPSSNELRQHTTGLYKRIRRSWPSFEAFCDEIGVEPPRRNVLRTVLAREPR